MPSGCKRWKAQYSLSTCRLLPVAAFCNGNDVNIHVEKPVKWWWTSYQVQLFIFHFSDMRAKSHVIRFQSVLVAVSFEICDHKNDNPLKKIKRGKKAKPPPPPKPLEIAQLFGQASPALYSLYPPAPTHPHPHRDRASMDRLCGWSLLHWLIGWPNTDDACIFKHENLKLPQRLSRKVRQGLESISKLFPRIRMETLPREHILTVVLIKH